MQQRASHDKHVDGGGPLASEKTRALIDRRRRRGNIVDEQDAEALHPSSRAQRKRSADVPPAIRLVEADLRKGAAHPDHESGIDRQGKPPCRLAG